MSNTNKDSQSKQPLENEERGEKSETMDDEQRTETGYANKQRSGVPNEIPVGNTVGTGRTGERTAQLEEELERLKEHFTEKQQEVENLKTELAISYSEMWTLRIQINETQRRENIAETSDQNIDRSAQTESLENLLKEKIKALEGVMNVQAEKIKKLEKELHQYRRSPNVVLQSDNLVMEGLDLFEQITIQDGDDSEDGTNRAEGSDNFKQENSIMQELHKGYYCPVSCVSMVISLIFVMMGLPVCNRRLNKKLQNELCSLSKVKEEDFEIGNCSLAFEEFYDVDLIKKEPKFFKKIDNAVIRRDTLRDAIATMDGESNPALFRMHYKERQNGTKRAGHCVAITPDGKFIDLRKEGYWEPEKDPLWKRVNLIEVWEVNKKIAEQWEKECGRKLCQAECWHNVHNLPL